jgi:hypothetical protein
MGRAAAARRRDAGTAQKAKSSPSAPRRLFADLDQRIELHLAQRACDGVTGRGPLRDEKELQLTDRPPVRRDGENPLDFGAHFRSQRPRIPSLATRLG